MENLFKVKLDHGYLHLQHGVKSSSVESTRNGSALTDITVSGRRLWDAIDYASDKNRLLILRFDNQRVVFFDNVNDGVIEIELWDSVNNVMIDGKEIPINQLSAFKADMLAKLGGPNNTTNPPVDS